MRSYAARVVFMAQQFVRTTTLVEPFATISSPHHGELAIAKGSTKTAVIAIL